MAIWRHRGGGGRTAAPEYRRRKEKIGHYDGNGFYRYMREESPFIKEPFSDK